MVLRIPCGSVSSKCCLMELYTGKINFKANRDTFKEGQFVCFKINRKLTCTSKLTSFLGEWKLMYGKVTVHSKFGPVNT